MRLFVLIGGLLVVVLVTALLAPFFVNWSDYKGRFEAEATRLLGHPVRVAGEASARILPFPSVSFADVEVGPPEAPLVVAESFSFDAELAPFLSGEVLIFDMRIVDPVVNISLDENGVPIWRLPELGLIDPAQITLENAIVQGGTLVVLDPADERRWTLSGIDISVSANSFFGPWRAEGTARLGAVLTDFVVSTGQLTREGFSLRIAANLPNQLARIISDGRIAPNDAGQMTYAGALTLLPHQVDQTYRIEGEFAATARSLDVNQFRGAFGASDDPYVVNGEAALFGGREPGYRLVAQGNQVNVPVGAQAEQGTATQLREQLSAINAMIAGLPWPGVPGTVNLDLPAIVAGNTTIRDVQLLARPEPDGADRRRWRIDRLDALLPGRTAIEADGVMTLPRPGAGIETARFDGNLLVASRQPSGLARWLTGTVTEPIRRLSGAGITAQVALDTQRQVAENVEIIIDEASLTGRMARSGGGSTAPYLTVDLGGSRIDWPTLEVLSSVMGAEAGGMGLGGHDVDLSLALSDVDLAGVPAATLETVIRARGSRTEVDRLVATGVHGASITGAGALERVDEGDLAVTFDASVVALNGAPFAAAMAERFAGQPLLDHLASVGRRDRAALADVELTAVGSARTRDARSMMEVAASLSGALGGVALFAQANLEDTASTEALDALTVEGSLNHDDALRLLPLAGVPMIVGEGATVGLAEPGEARFTLLRGDDGVEAVTLTAAAGADRFSFDGRLTGGAGLADLDGTTSLTLADAEPWLSALGHLLPGTGLGTPAEASAQLVRQEAVWRFDDLAGSVAGSALTGRLTYTDDAIVGRSLRGVLDVAELDAAIVAGLLIGHVEPLLADTVFGAPLYDDLAVQLDVSADRLFAGPVTLSDAETSLSMNGGLLTVQDLTAHHGSATVVTGNLRVQNADGAVSLGGEVSLQGAPLADLVAVELPVSGLVDTALSMTGGGETLAGLGASLTGTGVATARDLLVAGIEARAFDPVITAADEIGFGITPEQIEAIVDRTLFSGETALGVAEAPVTVTGGIARIANLVLGSPDGALTLAGDVTLDLIDQRPSAMLTATLEPGDEAVGGMAPAVGLAAAAEAGDALALATDMQPITAYLTQRALEIEQLRIEKLQARLLERQRLRRELRYARFRRTEANAVRNEERLRALGRERFEILQEAARRDAEAAAIRQIVETAPPPPPGLIAPPPPPPEIDAGGTLVDDRALPEEGAVLRAPLPPAVLPSPRAGSSAPAPSIDFSEDAVRSLLEGLDR